MVSPVSLVFVPLSTKRLWCPLPTYFHHGNPRWSVYVLQGSKGRRGSKFGIGEVQGPPAQDPGPRGPWSFPSVLFSQRVGYKGPFDPKPGRASRHGPLGRRPKFRALSTFFRSYLV